MKHSLTPKQISKEALIRVLPSAVLYALAQSFDEGISFSEGVTTAVEYNRVNKLWYFLVTSKLLSHSDFFSFLRQKGDWAALAKIAQTSLPITHYFSTALYQYLKQVPVQTTLCQELRLRHSFPYLQCSDYNFDRLVLALRANLLSSTEKQNLYEWAQKQKNPFSSPKIHYRIDFLLHCMLSNSPDLDEHRSSFSTNTSESFSRNSFNETKLIYVIRTNDKSTSQDILDSQESRNYSMLVARDGTNMNAIMCAIAMGNVEILKKIISLNIFRSYPHSPLTTSFAFGYTPLTLAIHLNHLEIIKYLLSPASAHLPNVLPEEISLLDDKKYLHINIPNEMGWTALHHAAYKGQRDVLALILPYANKCSFTAIAKEPLFTPAGLAAYRNNVQALDMLLNYEWTTPPIWWVYQYKSMHQSFFTACRYGAKETVKHFLNRYRPSLEDIEDALEEPLLATIKTLLEDYRTECLEQPFGELFIEEKTFTLL